LSTATAAAALNRPSERQPQPDSGASSAEACGERGVGEEEEEEVGDEEGCGEAR